jgi:hypothetical protein
MHLAHKALTVFDDPDLDLTQFIEQRIFSRCDQVLVSWPRGVGLMRHLKPVIFLGYRGYQVLQNTCVSLKSSRTKCPLVVQP